MPDEMPAIYQEAMRFRAAIRTQNTDALKRLTQAYGRIYERLQTLLRALEADILEAQATGVQFSRDWLRRQQRYRELIVQVQDELSRYAVVLEAELDSLARQAIEAASRDAYRMVADQLPLLPPAIMRGVWNRLPVDDIETLLGFLSPGSPLQTYLAQYGEASALAISQAMEESIALGYSPRKLASILRQQVGMPLTSALRLARTTQINAYREATRAAYMANERLVPTWTWVSALDPKGTCLACVAKHGSIHPVTERLNDHHQGWCVAIPNPVSYRSLGLDVDGPPLDTIETGEEWFKKLPEAQQRAFMSGAAWDAWKEGKVTLAQFAGSHTDDVWGDMIRELPVKALLDSTE